MEENETKENTKTITIKSALVSDKEYLDSLATQLSCTVAEVLTRVVNDSKTFRNLSVNNEETNKQLENLQEKINLLTADKTRLTEENETLKNKKPEVTIEKEIVEKTITIEKPLADNQLIVTLPEELNTEIRKYRKFIKEKNFKKFNEFMPDAPFGERLVTFSVTRFVNLFKSEYID